MGGGGGSMLPHAQYNPNSHSRLVGGEEGVEGGGIMSTGACHNCKPLYFPNI